MEYKSQRSQYHNWLADFEAVKATKAFRSRARRVRKVKNNKTLGEGSYGKVLLKMRRKRPYAVKEFFQKFDDSHPYEVEEFALREVDTYSRLKHPFLFPCDQIEFKDRRIQLWMPLAYGTVFDLALDNKHYMPRVIRLQLARLMFYVGAHALLFLHQQGMLHRDVKPENFLFGKNGVYLSDFGSAKYALGYTFDQKDDLMSSGLGTYYYRAPEIYTKTYGPGTDIYSLCASVIHIVIGDGDFGEPHGRPTSDAENALLPEEWKDVLDDYENDLDAEFYQILAKGIDPDPSQRIKLQEVLQSSYFRNYHPRNSDPPLGKVITFAKPKQSQLGITREERSRWIRFMLAREKKPREYFENATYVQAVNLFDDILRSGFWKQQKIKDEERKKIFCTLCVGIAAKLHERCEYEILFDWDSELYNERYVSPLVLKFEQWMLTDLNFIVIRRRPPPEWLTLSHRNLYKALVRALDE